VLTLRVHHLQGPITLSQIQWINATFLIWTNKRWPNKILHHFHLLNSSVTCPFYVFQTKDKLNMWFCVCACMCMCVCACVCVHSSPLWSDTRAAWPNKKSTLTTSASLRSALLRSALLRLQVDVVAKLGVKLHLEAAQDLQDGRHTPLHPLDLLLQCFLREAQGHVQTPTAADAAAVVYLAGVKSTRHEPCK